MDLNHRPPGPEPGALARLRYAPTVYPTHYHALAATFSSGEFSVFRPFRPITMILDGSSKPKPAFSAISLRNATSRRTLSYRSDIPWPAWPSQNCKTPGGVDV